MRPVWVLACVACATSGPARVTVPEVPGSNANTRAPVEPEPPILDYDLPPGFEPSGAAFFRRDTHAVAVSVDCRSDTSVDGEMLQEQALAQSLSMRFVERGGAIGPWPARGTTSTEKDRSYTTMFATLSTGEVVAISVTELGGEHFAEPIFSGVSLPSGPRVPRERWKRYRVRCGGKHGTVLDLDVPSWLLPENTFRIAHYGRFAPPRGEDVMLEATVAERGAPHLGAETPLSYPPCPPQRKGRWSSWYTAFPIAIAGRAGQLEECHRDGEMDTVVVGVVPLDGTRVAEIRGRTTAYVDPHAREAMVETARAWTASFRIR